MTTTLAGFVLAALLAGVLMFGVRALAFRIGAVDQPDGCRKVHTRPIPTLGGVGVWLAGFTPIVLVILLAPRLQVGRMLLASPALPKTVAGLAVGGTLALIFGIWDDLKGMRPRLKLLLQLFVAILAWAMGFRIHCIEIAAMGWSFDIGAACFPLTIFWFLGCMNAINLIDGLDGLAAGLSLLVLLCMTTTGALFGNIEIAFLTACMAGATFGFLFHNFHPAKIFLGDSGSMFLGFCIAALSVSGATMRGNGGVALLIPVTALGLPIIDTALAMLRRWVRHMPLSAADRAHIHHRLLRMGLGHRQVVLLLWGVSLLFACGALVLATAADERALLVTGSIGIAAMVFARVFGGVKLSHVFSRFRGDFRQHVLGTEAKLAVNRVIQELANVQTVDAMWQYLTEAFPGMGLDYARLTIRDAGEHSAAEQLSWRLQGLPPHRDGELDFWQALYHIEFEGIRLGSLVMGRHVDGRGQAHEIFSLAASLQAAVSRRLAVILGVAGTRTEELNSEYLLPRTSNPGRGQRRGPRAKSPGLPK